MRSPALALSLLLAVVVAAPAVRADDAPPSASVKKKKLKKKKKKADAGPAAPLPLAPADPWALRPHVKLDGEAAVGGWTGERSYHAPGALGMFDLGFKPGVGVGFFDVEAELDLAYRQTMPTSLDETRAGVGLSVSAEPLPDLEITVDAMLGTTLRPRWPDLYQSEDGLVVTTDRYSHVDQQIGVKLVAEPIDHNKAKAKLRYVQVAYTQDPAFDALTRPNHLTPGDHDQLDAELAWRNLHKDARAGVAVSGFRRGFFFRFARDAQTGSTHAGPGGAPPNPLLVVWGLGGAVDGELDFFDDAVTVGAEARLLALDDEYQGYTSALEGHFQLEVEVALPAGARLEAAASTALRFYGDTSYAAGKTHVPLDEGDRLQDRRTELRARLSRELLPGVAGFLDGQLRLRRTNFPDYIPGVFPSDQQYDIDRDWQHARLLAGIEVKFR